MRNEEAIVEIQHVSKRFGKVLALDDVSLEMRPGRIIGLLGANGSGKSTLLRHIIGLYLADRGRCITFGCEAGQLGPAELGRIGYVHQEGELLDWMNVKQLIRYVRAHYPSWNGSLEETYRRDFEVSLKARVGSLSPGQRQKLSILLAIGFEPELLILDEPVSALDPIARAQFLNLLLEIIQDQGRTIIISSHILSDVEKIIDHVLIMKAGRLIRDCGFDDLREGYYRVQLRSLNGSLPEQLPFDRIVDCRRGEKQALLVLQNADREIIAATAESIRCQAEVDLLPLEDLYRITMKEEAK